MNPAELRADLKRLYRVRGQTLFAKRIGVNPRTVRSWLAGRHPIPKYLPLWLKVIAEERATHAR